MNLLGSLAIAFSMYSRIPMPQVNWTKERMKYAMCFFPLIGVIIGAVINLWYYGMSAAEFSYFAILVPVVIPLVITGGIHMDGFLDVVDARASHADREKKLEILKDPHTGAFAIIGCGVYLVLYAAAFAELNAALMPAFGAVFVLTRALSGLAVVWFPKAKDTGLAAAFSSQAQKKAVGIMMILYLLLSVGFIWDLAGAVVVLCCILAAAAVYGYYYRMSMKEFGGITGDLAGYFLQICELTLLIVLAVLG